MTYRLILLITSLLFVTSCSKKADEPTLNKPNPQKVAGADLRAVLDRTESYEEAVAVNAAAALAKAHTPLASHLAERCWIVESKRPKVRQACALAWSIGTESSSSLEQNIRAAALDESTRSRALSISVIRRRDLVASLTAQELLALFTTLENDPVWLRAMAARDWLRVHEPSGKVEATQVWESLRVNKKPSRSADPATLGISYTVARMLGLASAEEYLVSFCAPGVTGLATARCWRFMSTLITPDERKIERDISLFVLPSRKDSGWRLFERSFPERASLLDRIL